MSWLRCSLQWMVCACILVGWSAPVLAQAPSGVIEGRITDGQTDAPLPGANVVLHGEGAPMGTTTNPEGFFEFPAVEAGTYRLEASSVGYRTERATVRVATDASVTVDFALERRAYKLNEVVVSATRREEELATVPSSVSVLGPATLDPQMTLTSDLGDMLAQAVPGLGSNTHSLSNYGQTLRGRNLFVLVDGIPQTVPLRNALRDLRTVSASAIGRVEVVRGASALYGYGGGGGVINLIPKQPQSIEPTFQTEVGTRVNPAQMDDSFSGRLAQQVAGRYGAFDYLVSGAYESWGHFFDGQGDRIPQDPQGQGGLAGADEVNLLARVGAQLDAQQRLQLMVNLYDFKQDVEYTTVPGTPGEEKATAQPDPDVSGRDPGTRNVVTSLTYLHEAVAGSQFATKLYLQDYKTRFGFFEGFPEGGGQGFLTSTKLGARIDVETPLPLTTGSTLLWGLDALRDRTAQPLEDGRTYVPPITQLSAAPFAQAKLPVGKRAVLRAGARYETFRLSVDDYTTLFGGNRVAGGTLTYDALVFNLGGVLTLVDGLDLFGGFSQGFSVADVGRTLRGTQATSVETLRPEAQTVNNYELGLRGGAAVVSGSVAGFVNTSDLGTTFGDLPELRIIRSPERIRGVEAEVDVQPLPPLRFGGSVTVQEGKRDADDDGDYETYLPGPRIPPTKLTGYVAYTPVAGWQNRLQVLHSGARDRFDGEAETVFGQGDVESYTVFDLSTAVEIGAGTVALGVENLFDTFYFPSISQWYNLGTGYSAAPGRQVSLTYTVTW